MLLAGRYRLQSRIGDGGMGSVWLATDQLLNRDVAVKRVVSLDGVPEESAVLIRDKALREGRIAAQLAHPNAVAVHDVALDSGTPWLIMEYLPSRSLAQILHTVGTLGPVEAAQIGAQVAAAMTAAHAAGIIHRDIKPGNILVAGTGPDAGLVKLTDFGIAHHEDEDHPDDDDVITGTPAYFAPEVARGMTPGEPSDVYSLGATIYTLVEGEPPFGADDDAAALLDKVARAQIRPPHNAGPLEPALLAMLTPGPTRRPTMAQARDLLAHVAATANRTTPDRVLTGRLRRADGAVPVWALTTPKAPRMITGSYPRSYLPAAPYPSGPVSAARTLPAPGGPGPRAPQTSTARAGWSRYRTLLASGVILAVLIVALALIMWL